MRLYNWLWKNTTGEPYTYIMRRNPAALLVPEAVALLLCVFVAGGYWWTVPLTYACGLITGHVLWGRATVRIPKRRRRGVRTR